jgi:hypothetical protein
MQASRTNLLGKAVVKLLYPRLVGVFQYSQFSFQENQHPTSTKHHQQQPPPVGERPSGLSQSHNNNHHHHTQPKPVTSVCVNVFIPSDCECARSSGWG